VKTIVTLLACLLASAAQAEDDRQLLWGDTHLHTSYSFDAYLFRNHSADPDTAYRYARGLPVIHPFHRARVKINTPLDFLVIADHAELTAVPKRIFEGDQVLLNTQFGKDMAPLIEAGEGGKVFQHLVARANAGTDDSRLDELLSEEIRTPAWHDIVDAADRHNTPGTFTALIGWEWSSIPDAANLHRVVFMANDGEVAKRFLPFGSTQSDRPEDLWNWLAQTSAETGAEFVAIPHNMNISKGKMFALVDSDGAPLTKAYAEQRSAWEPVAEVTQIKGDSETHPMLSPNDEFADFETYRFLIDTRPDTDHLATVTRGDYARGGLLRGLKLSAELGANPYQFGMIGSTDAHTGLASAEENNFHGKMAVDSTPEVKHEPRISGSDGPKGWNMAAQGLAAVWATENTRDAIVAAFKRREVYGTTGPRIAVRFFGGYEFSAADATAPDLAARGYAKGVSMGGELAPRGTSVPTFLIHAASDASGANLDRVQIVKGWLGADGEPSEQVYNVTASDGRTVAADGTLPAVGNTVNLTTARYSNDIGARELAAVWQDPDFDPAQPAFYYARVLEIPTPRHSLLDAVSLDQPPIEGITPTIQERAYTSPIWYTPWDKP
jgi:hypothetical protein